MSNDSIKTERPELKSDERGWLVELFKVPGVGQVFYSITKPGYTRGDHYHRDRKIERFCVVSGKGEISLRNRETGERREFDVSGDKPEIIDMPLNWTHNIKNTGEEEMGLVIWANEVFNPADPDTFAEKV